MVRQAPASPDTPLTLRAYLKHSHRKYIDLASEISNPLSSRYGQYLNAEQLRLELPDSRVSASKVNAWLNETATIDINVGEDWIDFQTTVGAANTLLNTTFRSYSFGDSDAITRTESYGLPRDMLEYIDFIYPTVHFFNPVQRKHAELQRRQRAPTGPVNCSNSVCPKQLEDKYHITYRPKDNKSGSKIGIAGFLDTFPNVTDVKEFLSKYGAVKRAAFPNYRVESISNGTNTIPSASGALTVEPELDLDYSIAFTGPLDATFFSTGGQGIQLDQPGNKPNKASNNEPYLEFLQYILRQRDPPQVISISYSDDEQSVPIAYARRVCDLLSQAATRGISVIGASGDGGAGGTGIDSSCKGPDGKHRFIPTFPSSCPWITSVGATAGYGGAASFSSGGFSNYFTRPEWQYQNVTAYVQELNGKHRGFYNASGRGIPDVSLIGDGYLTLTGGLPLTHDGTSASTPVFAAMVALINDIRLRKGKPVLGFLNPLLYSNKARSIYRDVSDNSQSNGCADGNFFEPGWEALKGWDAATGLGEPDFGKLRALST